MELPSGGDEITNTGGGRYSNSVCGVRTPNRNKLSKTVVLYKVQKEKKENAAKCVPTGIWKSGEDESQIFSELHQRGNSFC